MNINQKARKFMRQYGLNKKEVTLQNVKEIAFSFGYEVIFFNPNKELHVELLKKVTNNFYDISKPAITSELNGKKTIFIHFFSSEEEKLFLLLHELAHLYLNHFYNSEFTDTTKELQANRFADCVIKRGKNSKKLTALIAGTVIASVSFTALSAVFIRREVQQPVVMQTTTLVSPAPEIVSESTPQPEISITVFVTKSGKKYHRSGCCHLSGRETLSLSPDDARSAGYEPCKSCLPDEQ